MDSRSPQGREKALELTQSCQPLGARKAQEIGFLDDIGGEDVETFESELRLHATQLAQGAQFRLSLLEKHTRRLDDEYAKPLAHYRCEELYALRKQTPEPVFGIIKSVLGFRQFSMRGLEKARGEWSLVTMAWNMKRMFAIVSA
jgi:hypothetical protein